MTPEEARLTEKWGPFCLLTYQRATGNYAPRGKRRYRTLPEALAAATQLEERRVDGRMVFVDAVPIAAARRRSPKGIVRAMLAACPEVQHTEGGW